MVFIFFGIFSLSIFNDKKGYQYDIQINRTPIFVNFIYKVDLTVNLHETVL